MRKKLLSLVALAFVAIGISAQTWTAPEKPSFEYEGLDPVSGGVYRVLNVESGQFLAGGQVWHSWSTSTALTSVDKALQFTLTQYTENLMEDEDPYWTFARTTDGKFTFISAASVAGHEGWGEMHVDMNNQGHQYFELLKQENGTYHIRAQRYDSDYGEGMEGWEQKCWGWAGPDSEPTNAVYGSLDPAEGFYCDWLFVQLTQEQMDEIKAANDFYTAKLALFQQYQLIIEENLAQYGVSYGDYTEAYNGDDITAIKEATTALAAAVVEARKTKAFAEGSDENPTDVTFLLANPTLAGNMNGWTIDVPNAQNKQYQGASYTNDAVPETDPNYGVTIAGFIEAWLPSGGAGLGNGKIYQSVELPLGKYILGVDVMATNQAESDLEMSRETVEGLQLYALGGGIDNGVDVRSRNGKPEHYDFEFITAGGTTELGLRMVNATANWFGADNFTLKYKGNDIDPYFIGLPQVIASAEALEATLSEVYANTTVKDDFTDALSAARETYNDPEGNFQEAYTNLSNAIEALNTSIAEYKKLEALVARAQADADDYEGFQIGDDISDNLDEYNGGLEDGTATNEQIEAWIEAYDPALLEGVKAAFAEASAEKPLKISILGSNLDYADNAKEPWVATLTTSLGGDGYKVNYHNGEVWQNSFSCLQTISDLPAGQYTIKAKAFYRDGGNAATYEAYQNGEFQVTTYLVANANKQAVPCLAVAAELGETAPEGSAYAQTSGDGEDPSGIWMPNSQQSAEWAFINHADDLTCEVSTYLANDGDLTFGMRNDDIAEANNQWSVWTGFEIYYTGKSVNALYDQVQALMDQASSMNVEKNVAADQKIQNALTAGDEVTPESSEADLTAVANQLIEAIEYAQNYAALETKLRETTQTYYDLLYTATIVGSDNSLDELLQQVQAVLDDESGELTYASNEEIEEWIATMPTKWFAYVLSQDGFEDASETNALDVTTLIINADFEAAASRGQQAPYWTTDPMGANNGYQDNNTYSNGEIVLDHFIECWRNGAVLDDGRIYQTLAAALPAGFYTLEADAHAVFQNGYPEGGIQGVTLMVTDGEKYWETPIAVDPDITSGTPKHFVVPFESDGTSVLTVGIRVQSTNANWLAADNFKLMYIGQTAPDAVENIAAATEKKTVVIYNLAGQRVQKAVRGLYIINGKKVLVK